MPQAAEGSLLPAAPESGDRPDLIRSLPFILVHVAALSAFLIPFEAWYVGLAVGLYYVRMFGVTAGYHRYFSHRSYKTSRAFQFVLACLAMSSAEKGVLWWAAHHREHHRWSDQPPDVHSPVQRGFFWAHMGWILAPRNKGVDLARICGFRALPGAALARQVVLRAARRARRRALSLGRVAGADLGLLRVHGAPVARHLHDQLARPRLRKPAVSDARRQPQQLVSGAPHPGRGLAQQPPPLPGRPPTRGSSGGNSTRPSTR